ncbi:hypothetical protein WJX72_009242 [[Myrmecia] bisecta]|uniref:Kinesin-like protein n=1 Tax=[Myrmecia] bisecta TaxID=41462 RepID=A0AAW1R8R1_9CHLO
MRPLNAQEKDSRQHSSWTAADDKTLKFRDTPEKAHAHLPTAYHYDRVFSEQYNTQAVYEAAGRERVLSALQGLNSTLFVYGQTGSGKTYTMRSIVAAASEDIFKHIKANPGREFLIRLSAIEIYNERVRDLLQDGTEMQDLQLREHADKGTVAEGLSDEGIRSAAHLASLLQAVEARRTVRDTRLNAESSRSHQIVRIYVESRPASAEEDPAAEIAELDTLDTKSDGDEPEDLRPVKISTLNFVDLAGSERSALAAKADGMEKIRHAEGSSINKSLLTLGKVIRDLADAKAHIPFRDSKLTRMLQPSLGGNSRTAIICTISPASGAIDNTRTALHFANAAKNVRVQPKVNEVLNERALLRRMQAEIASLRRQLATRDFAVEAAELSAALREKEQHIKLTEGQKAEAEKRLRNLERLILRGDGNGTVKRRKSWSALPSPKSDLVAGGTASQMSARQAAAMRMSWNHGDASASLDSPNSTRKHLFQMQAMRGNNRGDKLLLDCFINPAIRHACPPADHAQPSAASLSAGSSAAAAIPSSPANDLKRIEQLQEDRVMEVAAREETISALRAELARLQDAQSAQRAADEALASLQSKIDALQMSREGSLRGSLTDQAGSSALPAEGPAVKAGDQPGTPAHRRPSSPDARIQRVAPGDDSPCDAFARSPSSSPLMDSPVRSLDAQDDKENSLEPLSQSRIHLTADTRANGGTPLTMAGLMYKSEVRRMQAAFKEAVQRDVAGLKEALEQYREQVQRLECQKQLLLNQTLMPKIVAMWEELHVPLVHRSRFYLAFRGRETFYYEAEHRRLCYLRALIIGTAEEDDSSPAEQRQTQKKLEKARRKLEWERKFLAQQLKWDCTPEEREEMFLQWNVHRDSKERKLQLVRRLWSPPVIQDTEGMRKSSELVLRLNGTEATDGMFDLVFGRSQGDGWVKSMLATGGSMLGPVLSKVVVGGQAALRGSSPSKPGKVGERRRSFLGSLGLTPRRQSSRTAAAWS